MMECDSYASTFWNPLPELQTTLEGITTKVSLIVLTTYYIGGNYFVTQFQLLNLRLGMYTRNILGV